MRNLPGQFQRIAAIIGMGHYLIVLVMMGQYNQIGSVFSPDLLNPGSRFL
jgi:hypothetical protein